MNNREKIDYYSTDEEISWIASRVFSDEHYGRTLTEIEFQERKGLEEEYKDEIALAKLMLENNPKFIDLPFKTKINISANCIMELREMKNKNNSNSK